jgi:hypothetical protein
MRIGPFVLLSAIVLPACSSDPFMSDHPCNAKPMPVTGSPADFTLSSQNLSGVLVGQTIPCSMFSDEPGTAIPLAFAGAVKPSGSLIDHLETRLTGPSAPESSLEEIGTGVCIERPQSPATEFVKIGDWKSADAVVQAVADQLRIDNVNGEVLIVIAPQRGSCAD